MEIPASVVVRDEAAMCEDECVRNLFDATVSIAKSSEAVMGAV